jgi:hypothetical protein
MLRVLGQRGVGVWCCFQWRAHCSRVAAGSGGGSVLVHHARARTQSMYLYTKFCSFFCKGIAWVCCEYARGRCTLACNARAVCASVPAGALPCGSSSPVSCFLHPPAVMQGIQCFLYVCARESGCSWLVQQGLLVGQESAPTWGTCSVFLPGCNPQLRRATRSTLCSGCCYFLLAGSFACVHVEVCA